jgi:LPPG:FO 2-phospho-L-lactate transferase
VSCVAALCGGVGGAKLALGLSRALQPEELTLIVNTGDDFEHLGLSISPDIDTVLYTLSGLADRERGWGRDDETWNFMTALGALGGETWFQLGDRDLATHVERSRRLAAGETLSSVTALLAARLGIGARIAPMSDDRVRTIVHTPDGPLSFQHYFVRERCAPRAVSISFDGADTARMSAAFAETLERRDLAAVIICPSNPYLSIDPILAVPGVRAALARIRAPRIAVSPIIGGEAVKGPTAKLMRELGVAVTSASIAAHYRGLIDVLVIEDTDASDAATVTRQGVACATAPTLMRTDEDKLALARTLLDLARTFRRDAA